MLLAPYPTGVRVIHATSLSLLHSHCVFVFVFVSLYDMQRCQRSPSTRKKNNHQIMQEPCIPFGEELRWIKPVLFLCAQYYMHLIKQLMHFAHICYHRGNIYVAGKQYTDVRQWRKTLFVMTYFRVLLFFYTPKKYIDFYYQIWVIYYLLLRICDEQLKEPYYTHISFHLP